MAGRRAPTRKPVAVVQTPKVADAQTQRALDTLAAAVMELQARAGAVVLSGNASPEGTIAAAVGTLYVRLDGGASSALYVKESGTGATGWVAK